LSSPLIKGGRNKTDFLLSTSSTMLYRKRREAPP
jgi:hypothetical protein